MGTPIGLEVLDASDVLQDTLQFEVELIPIAKDNCALRQGIFGKNRREARLATDFPFYGIR